MTGRAKGRSYFEAAIVAVNGERTRKGGREEVRSSTRWSFPILQIAAITPRRQAVCSARAEASEKEGDIIRREVKNKGEARASGKAPRRGKREDVSLHHEEAVVGQRREQQEERERRDGESRMGREGGRRVAWRGDGRVGGRSEGLRREKKEKDQRWVQSGADRESERAAETDLHLGDNLVELSLRDGVLLHRLLLAGNDRNRGKSKVSVMRRRRSCRLPSFEKSSRKGRGRGDGQRWTNLVLLLPSVPLLLHTRDLSLKVLGLDVHLTKPVIEYQNRETLISSCFCASSSSPRSSGLTSRRCP